MRYLLRLVGVLGFLLPLAARAQSPEIVDALIQRVVADVADLRYADAIGRARELLRPGAALTPAQEIRLRTALAAAFYPDEEGEQRPDSALAQFDRVVRLAPDAELPITLAWPGLDSLLARSRARTFAVLLRAAADSFEVDGSGVPLGLVVSRPALLRLETRPVGGRALARHDATLDARATATLRLRAQDRQRLLLQHGDYDLVVTALDPARGDSVQYVRRLIVTGAPPALLPTPVLDSTRLRPERREPRPGRTALTGLLFGTVTLAIASGARAEEPVRSAFGVDGRSALVAAAAVTAGVMAAWTDRDGVDDEAVAFNAALRDAHERAVAAALAENARRLANHRVRVLLAGEVR